MTLADAVAAVMLAALVLYVLTAGADFGGGVWDLFATGPRAKDQRALIERALAPVWEANHVWLILIVVLFFTAFPPAFAAFSTALHVPLTIMLIGIVMRGSAFIFRQYGGGDANAELRWGRVFAIASVVTPVFLGVCLGAITSGRLTFENGIPSAGFFTPWTTLFPFVVGAFALALFAFLAAVYLCIEAESGPRVDRGLLDDFRKRAFAAQLALFATAAGAAFAAGPGTEPFATRLFGSPWSWPLQGATAVAALGSLWALYTRRFRAARLLAVAQASLIVLGWGAAQYPHLLRPGFTIAGAAAPEATLRLLLPTLGGGALVLIPSLYWLMKIFKSKRAGSA